MDNVNRIIEIGNSLYQYLTLTFLGLIPSREQVGKVAFKWVLTHAFNQIDNDTVNFICDEWLEKWEAGLS